jgi:uncharacterized protein
MITNKLRPMDRDLIWHWMPEGEPGVEHLHLRVNPNRVIADGMILGIADGRVFRLHYLLQCTSRYELQTAHLRLLYPSDQTLHLARDLNNVWKDEGARVLPALQGSTEIDIETSPFTNTLPIRRLALQQGQSGEIKVAYVTVPRLDIKPVRQRYTCIDLAKAHNVYLFENLDDGFTAEIATDEEGLILDYPGIFKRVWSLDQS